MMFAVRYPHRMSDMQAMGADMALCSDVARQLWDKLETYDSNEIFQQLDQREKNFWCHCRGPEAPPMRDEDMALSSLRQYLSNYYKSTQTSSLSAALRANTSTDDFEADLDYLRALKETLENGHHEQS